MPTYNRLTPEQRYTIEVMIRNKSSQKEIAKVIMVSPSTISRELRRSGMSATSYSNSKAQKHAKVRSHRPGNPISETVIHLVEKKLIEEQWSPQQISETFKHNGIARISHETIYQHIYRDKRRKGTLHIHLRHKCHSYRKRGSQRERRGRLKDQVSIDERPKIVEQRTRIGDWEMDTVIGKPGGPVLVTMVERKSRYALIALSPSKEAVQVGVAILKAMLPHKDKVLTKTYDNGKEFAHHVVLAELLDAKAYFAHPYHSWERGLNENTNGLIRQYFPKKSDFATLTPEEVQAVQDKLNSRPRKCLDYQTPNDIFFAPTPIALAA